MLVRLVSSKIPEYQNLIDLAIDKSLPTCEENARKLIYKDLLLDFAECWIFYQIVEDTTIINAVMITKITDNVAVGARVLTILAIIGLEQLSNKDFKEAFEDIKRFAKAKNCTKIDFYTNVEKIKRYARLFKIDRECTYFQLPMFNN